MNIRSTGRVLAALAACFALLLNTAVAAVATLNLDFGNSGAYVGDDGVLSSPGGNHWNEVRLTTSPPGSGISVQFHFPTPLLNEFGQPFDLGPDPVYPALPDVFGDFSEGEALDLSSFVAAPRNDGVRLPGRGNFGFVIRELSGLTPIDVAVYFTPGPEINTIAINEPFAFPPSDGVSTTNPPGGFGSFPGVEGIDYLRFTDVIARPTTIGMPSLPGVYISVPFDRVAYIAAIQVRGDFVSLSPEPSSITMSLLAAVLGAGLRRSRS